MIQLTHYSLFILIGLLFFTSCKKDHQLYAIASANSIEESYQEPTFIVYADWSIETFVKNHYDSLQKDIDLGIIPPLLSNLCYDYDNRYMATPHYTMSLRYQIIEQIEKQQMIDYLLQHSSKITKDTCTNLMEHPYNGPGYLLPHQGESTYQLLLNRQELLKEK